ncbi:MAG TPA: hypothetical protein VKX31_02270, partial [Brumimicrobium sp.]|nr:hypothetical protein [Brumimicrobium sp.]
MLKCDNQTYKDLEFEKIQNLLAEYCIGATALRMVNQLKPVQTKSELLKYLNQTDELVKIRREGEKLPALEFVELEDEIRKLPIRNASLSAKSFMNIRMASEMTNALLYFFNKREKDYPNLNALFVNIEFSKELIELIDTVFDKHGNVKDNASPRLADIRQQLVVVKRNVNATFDRVVRKYLKKGILSDTKEAFYNERRVLAVIASYKREVAGQIVGNSKTGSVTFIEPGEVTPLNAEYQQLQDDERNEIFLILQDLTRNITEFLPLITGYQHVLTRFDFINAKSRLAILLDCNLPSINDDKSFTLIDCYHPILKLNNKQNGKTTIPQHLTMHTGQRMLVISGPNAG